MELDLSLEEAFSGVTRPINFTRETACRVCGGTGAETYQQCETCKGTGKITSSKGFFRMSQICGTCGGSGRKVTKACRACGGSGRSLNAESMKVKIPPGADTGSRVRIKGMGGAGQGGGPSGDLQIEITVRPHPLFRRKGDNILLDVPVTFVEAVRGGKIEVPTVEGMAAMTLPPGTQGGQKFKLSGKGFPSSKGGKRGDQVVTIQVAVPRSVPDQAETALDEIGRLYPDSPRKGMVKKHG
jgi:molecular chaperone DnaJ